MAAGAGGGLRRSHYSPPSASRLIAPSMAKIIRLNQMPNTTAGIQKARTPFQAKGPVLNRPTASPGSSRTPVHRFIRSEEHTSELQSLMRISYAVFCLKKKKEENHNT